MYSKSIEIIINRDATMRKTSLEMAGAAALLFWSAFFIRTSPASSTIFCASRSAAQLFHAFSPIFRRSCSRFDRLQWPVGGLAAKCCGQLKEEDHYRAALESRACSS